MIPFDFEQSKLQLVYKTIFDSIISSTERNRNPSRGKEDERTLTEAD